MTTPAQLWREFTARVAVFQSGKTPASNRTLNTGRRSENERKITNDLAYDILRRGNFNGEGWPIIVYRDSLQGVRVTWKGAKITTNDAEITSADVRYSLKL